MRLAISGSEFSEGQGELNSQKWARFLGATMFFCKGVNYLYHYVYTNIFDIAESLTQNDHGPI